MSRTAALWELFTEDLDADPFHDKLDDDPLVISPGGSPPGGMPFLVNQLGDPNAVLILKVAFGASVKGNPQAWNFYDITADVRQADNNGISVSSMGRNDESSQSSPVSCTLQLDNTRGDYTRHSPASKWWPYVRRNTPIQFQMYLYGDTSVEFQGYATNWLPSWDSTGNLAIVTLSAHGILRRLNQGKTPLKSPFTRSITASKPIQHWTLEDGQNAVFAGSEVSGGTPMTASGIVKFGTLDPLTFGQSSGISLLPGTTFGFLNFPNFNGGGSLTASFSAGSSTSWGVQATVFNARDSADLAIVFQHLQWITADGAVWVLLNDFTATNTTYVTYNGATVCSVAGALIFDDIRIDAFQSGSDISVHLVRTPGGGHEATGTVTGKTLSGIVSMTISPSKQVSTGDWGVGEVRTWNGNSEPDFKTNNLVSAFWGYPGENVVARLTRLCSEEDIPIDVVGVSDVTMGQQRIATHISLLRECESTDDGFLGDGRGPGLYYITRQYRYNRGTSLSLDMSADPPQVAGSFEPVDDDQRDRNIAKVDQLNGSSAIYEDKTGPLGTDAIQDYDTSVPVNYGDETGLYNRAAHEVKKGTFDEFRFPKVSIDLAATPAIARSWRATRLSDRIDVLNATSKATQLPLGTISQILEGYSAFFSPFSWTAGMNCSPFSPWRVPVIESSVADFAWILDSGGSTLHQDYPAGTTSIVVDVSDGAFWSSSASDYPRDISVGGAQITVTGVGSGSADAFTRSSGSGWGNADTGETWSLIGAGGSVLPTDWTIGAGVGIISMSATNAYRISAIQSLSYRDVDIAVTFTAPLATGAPLEPGNIVLRGTTNTSYVLARVQVETTNAVTVLVFDALGNQLGAVPVDGITHAGTGTPLRTRVRTNGSQISIKVWNPAGAEPSKWNLVVTDPAAVIPGWFGVRCGVQAGNTNVPPIAQTFDDFQAIVSSQTFTISASPYQLLGGSSVSLWRPPKLAL